MNIKCHPLVLFSYLVEYPKVIPSPLLLTKSIYTVSRILLLFVNILLLKETSSVSDQVLLSYSEEIEALKG